VAGLALDDDQRHAFASELDGVRVPELVRRERRRTPAATALRRSAARAAALDQCRPRVGRLMMQNSGPTGSSSRSSSQGRSSSQAHASNLAAPSALATADEQGAAAVIEIGLGDAEGFLDA
jgi:hypothetical protein